MPLTRTKFYTFISIAIGVGYIWVLYNLFFDATQTPEVCLFKLATGIPCPSCGSTRSVLALLHGHVWHALLLNPFGAVIAVFLVISPFWLIYDTLTKHTGMFKTYQWLEHELKLKKYAIPLILLVLANWIWNIYKGN